ncbi:MAG: oligosaccharide flippase family protein [Bacteroidota bacterium]|nr:oligosaccharide flippase family protein [Bacteroidota bacterium]
MEPRFRSDKTKFIITLLSRVVTALVGIFFVPIYVNLIGIESYGLISFYSTLVGTLSLLDLGLSTAISRQISIDRAVNNNLKSTYDLIFSVEIIYWFIAFVLGVLIVSCSHLIASHWVNAEHLSVSIIQKVVLLMGIVFVFQFPISIYNGVMMGFERQIQNAVFTAVFSIVKAIGVVFVLMFIEASIEMYFIWQIAITIIFTLVIRIYIWRPAFLAKIKTVFSWVEIKKIWRFALGITGISAITFFITQLDKIVVSKMLTLEYVGYYSLAFLIASAINQLISPIQPVVFPKLTGLISTNDQVSIVKLYHQTARWVSIIIFPIGCVLFFFASEILMFWTGNIKLTSNTASILQVCVVGSVFNCMMWVPYLFMLAKGNTRFTIYQNSIVIIIMIPLLYFLTKTYGALGASFVWLIVNTAYVLVSIPVFHHFFLKGELMTWYKNDVALPLIASIGLVLGIKFFQIQFDLKFSLLSLTSVLLGITVIYTLIIPELRTALNKIIRS